MGRGPFEEMDPETARGVLTELETVATGPLAASFVDADRNPPVFDPATHSIRLPESFKKSYQAMIDGEWFRLEAPAGAGGLGAPPSLRWAAAELVMGANPSVFMYQSGPGMAKVLDQLGTQEQRQLASIMVEKHWGSTMVLTEPDAGSDVGAGRTKATQQPDGSWHLEGVKRFITSGDQDMTENIVHFVLARPEGDGIETRPGTKGLSLFVVPKYRFDWTSGELGERNGVFVTGVEHKMGLKVSTTCELSFGLNGEPAVGYLLGEVHDGIAQMFHVIEYARMLVGTKAIATLSTGYLNALEYAKQRVQGADLTRSSDKNAPRVTIIHHPDVRRILMRQKAYAEGLRAVYLYTGTWQDRIACAETDDTDVVLATHVNDLLLPVVKGVGSERAYENLALALQVFGGSGYTQDYPIEQYIRDAKIDTLYEGTTAIQAQDFFFRKIVRDQGAALGVVAGEIATFVEHRRGHRGRPAEGGSGAAGHRTRRRAAHGRHDGRLDDGRGKAAGVGLQGGRARGEPVDVGRRSAHRLPAGPSVAGRPGRTGRRRDRPGRRLLHRQAGLGPLVRPQRASRADRPAVCRAGGRSVADGDPRSGVLMSHAHGPVLPTSGGPRCGSGADRTAALPDVAHSQTSKTGRARSPGQ